MIAWRDKARRLGLWALCVSALLLGNSAAEAHLATTGLGPAYDGISHFLMSPEDLVPVFALALLAGQCGPEVARWILFILPATFAAGGLAGLAFTGLSVPDLTWLIFILLGSLVAAHLRPPRLAVPLLASAPGIFMGFANGAALTTAGALTSLLGMAATVFVVTALATAAAIAFTWPPAKVAVRVLGSWTAATGILLLGWSLR